MKFEVYPNNLRVKRNNYLWSSGYPKIRDAYISKARDVDFHGDLTFREWDTIMYCNIIRRKK